MMMKMEKFKNTLQQFDLLLLKMTLEGIRYCKSAENEEKSLKLILSLDTLYRITKQYDNYFVEAALPGIIWSGNSVYNSF